MWVMIFSKIKNYFNNSSKYYYLFESKRNSAIIYMGNNLTKKEKENNEKFESRVRIRSVKQGKRLLFRFLKNKHMYSEFIQDIKFLNISVDTLISNFFITPFFKVSQFLEVHHDKTKKEYLKLNKEWVTFLKSINYV
jgi:formyltetrahydrofolate hydrolase